MRTALVIMSVINLMHPAELFRVVPVRRLGRQTIVLHQLSTLAIYLYSTLATSFLPTANAKAIAIPTRRYVDIVVTLALSLPLFPSAA